jgi:8-oxo-dGTP pyrophosphatase MutT (NUDIX family)
VPEWGYGAVRAAGGVPVRVRDDGVEVLVVHRPLYDDWTFPKGKREPGETDEECALREVEEETGLRCGLEDELPSTAYIDATGRRKVVRYWRMRVLSGALEPASEADDARWVSPGEAARLLTYDADRGLLAKVSDFESDTGR